MAPTKNEKDFQAIIKEQDEQLNRYKKRLQGWISPMSNVYYVALFLILD